MWGPHPGGLILTNPQEPKADNAGHDVSQEPGPPSGEPKLRGQVIGVQGLRLGDSNTPAAGSTKGPQRRRFSGEVGSRCQAPEREVVIATVLRARSPSLFSGSMKPSSRADQSESGLGAKKTTDQMWPRSLPSLKKGTIPPCT